MTPDIVAAVFAAVTRTNRDGAMSIRDLRQWYITFGRHALARAATGAVDDVGSGIGAMGIVAPALLGSSTAPLAKTRSFKASGSAPAFSASGLTPAALLNATAGGGGSAASTASAVASRPLYAWEHGPSSAGASGDAPSLPHGMLEFQVRLTPAEHATVQLRRRMAEAEARYKARVAEAAARATARLGEGAAGGSAGANAVSTVRAEPYHDPVADKNAYFLRSD